MLGHKQHTIVCNFCEFANLSIMVSTIGASNHLIGYPAHQVNANWVQIDAELVNNFRSAQLSRSCFCKLWQSSWRSSMIQHDRHHLKSNFFSLYRCCMFGNFTLKCWLDLICVSNSYLTLTDKHMKCWTQDYIITPHCEIIKNIIKQLCIFLE